MAWTIEDPIVVEGVKMANITGYTQELDAFDLSECVVDGYDTSGRLELWLPHTAAAAFVADLDQWALSYLTSNVQKFINSQEISKTRTVRRKLSTPRNSQKYRLRTLEMISERWRSF